MVNRLAVIVLLALLAQSVWAAAVPVLRSGPNGLAGGLNRASSTDPTTGMEFMAIPGGCFRMGDTYGDGQGDEKPLHEVCLTGFHLGRYEVTNGQYRRFKPDHDSRSYGGQTLNDDQQPAVNLSWYDAVAFAQWLSKQSGRSYRLPTEAEWEYASRGGASSRNFWGNDPDEACRFANVADQNALAQWPEWVVTNCADGYRVAAPVGTFLPNGYGLHDMLGNAWEWTSDWYDAEYYFKSPKENPGGPLAGSLRVPRGGGWGNAAECVRAADRNGFAPEFRVLFLGFRLVATP